MHSAYLIYKMATLRDHCSLIQTSLDETFLGFNNSFRDLHVLVTKKGKSVTLYDVESLNAFRSWTCKPSESFTAAASIDTNGHYVAVVNDKVLRLWADDDLNLDSGQKITVSTPIHAIVSEQDKETVVIFKNGHVDILRQVLLHPTQERRGVLHDSDIIYDYCVVHTQKSVLVGLLVSKQQGSYDFIAVTLDNNNCEQKGQRWTLDSKQQTIKAVCILKCEKLTLVSISSDSGLYVFEPLASNASWQQLKLVTVPPTSSFVDVVPLNENHIALVGSNTDGFTVTILDLKYQVEKTAKTFSGFVFHKAFVCCKLLLLLCEKTVLVVPFEIESATLSAVVGSLASAATTNCQRFQLDSALNWIPVEDTENKQIIKLRTTRSSSTVESTSTLEQILPSEVKKSAHELLSEGKSTSVICRNVFNTLLESKKVDSLCAAIHAFEDIPEDIIVRLLQFFLGLNINGVSSKKLIAHYRETVKNDAISEVLDLKSSMINTLLCCPFNDVFLQEYVRTMSSQDIKLLLSHLCQCLDSPPEIPNNRHLDPSKVVDWICVILDARILNMTLSSDKELIGLFSQINIAIRSQFSYFEDLEKLELLVAQMKIKSSEIKSDDTSPYSIEILRIP